MTNPFKKPLYAATFAAVIVLQSPAHAQAPGSAAASLNKSDEAIVLGMARANMAEIAIAQLALTNAEDAAVKSFAQTMIDDHTRALNDVKALAQKKGLTVPVELDAKHKALAEKLGKLKGRAFDTLYMKQAGVEDHTQVRGKLKKDLAEAKDPDVKALAAKMLPTVEQHLDVAASHKH